MNDKMKFTLNEPMKGNESDFPQVAQIAIAHLIRKTPLGKEVQAALMFTDADTNVIATMPGEPEDLLVGLATIAGHLAQMVGEKNGASFDRASPEARARYLEELADA